MKFKSKPGAKIPTTQTNTNKKKEVDIASTPKPENNMSVIKKNEFALILIGALLLTVIVFFLFFKSSDGSKNMDLNQTTDASSFNLEDRMRMLEEKLSTLTSPSALNEAGSENMNAQVLDQRLTRLETAFAVKFDSVIERIAGLEKNIGQLKDRSSTAAPPAQKAVSPSPPKKTSHVAAKTPDPKKGVFHTVQKKETLYSIGKKYNTTVAALRKLNNLSEGATIYPGDNILVK